MATQPHSREQYPLRLNKRKEGRGGSDVLTFHASPQTTCPAHTAPAPCRLQDRADATDAMVLLTPRRPGHLRLPFDWGCPASHGGSPAYSRRRADLPLHAVLDEQLADPAAPNSSMCVHSFRFLQRNRTCSVIDLDETGRRQASGC